MENKMALMSNEQLMNDPGSPGRMTELSWGTLPGEVLVQIFSHLHYRDTVLAGRVCRHWSAVSRDQLLLAAIVQRDFSPEFVARVVNCVVVGLVKSGHLPSEVR